MINITGKQVLMSDWSCHVCPRLAGDRWIHTPNRTGVVWVGVTHPWLHVLFAFGGCLGECLGECKYPWLMPSAKTIG